MELESVQTWIDAYLEAWRTNDPERIGALFSHDATYAYTPWQEPLQGREAIVADWLDDPDEPNSWEADYHPILIKGTRAVVTGVTRYVDDSTYWNVFVIGFDATGRCREFAEWYMRDPKTPTADG